MSKSTFDFIVVGTGLEGFVVMKKITASLSNATGLPEIIAYNDLDTPIGPFMRYQLYQLPNGIRASADSTFLSEDVMTKGGVFKKWNVLSSICA